LKFVAHRCVGDACFEEIPLEAECEEEVRLWSNPKHWDQAKEVDTPFPEEGGSFVIPSGWNMHFDLAESPIFDKIEINGCLTFKQGTDLHLRAKKILIRGGELNIGSKDKPFNNNAKITLYGGKDEETIAIEDQGIEAGSKIIANIGTLNMYGK
jgi:hypothetical protein